MLRELEGLSYREIGDRMGMSRPAVESTLFRARRRLTEEYDDLVTGARCMRIQSLIVTAAGGAAGHARRRAGSPATSSHCQPCRREAMAAGLDAAILTHVPLRKRAAAKVAGLLPFPLFERFRGNAATHAPMLSEGLSGGWGKLATAAAVVAAGVGAAGVGTQIARHDSSDASPKRAAATSTSGGAADKSAAATATVHRAAGSSLEGELRFGRKGREEERPGRPAGRVRARPAGGSSAGTQPVAAGGTGAGSSGGGTSLPKVTLPTSAGDPAAPVKQVVNQVTQPVAPVVNGVTQSTAPVTDPVTDTVHQVLPPPVDDAVDDVTDVVEDGTGIKLP